MSDETMNSLHSPDSLTARFRHKVTESYPCGLLKNRISGTFRSFATRVSQLKIWHFLFIGIEMFADALLTCTAL
jgi:hypothetical protein